MSVQVFVYVCDKCVVCVYVRVRVASARVCVMSVQVCVCV